MAFQVYPKEIIYKFEWVICDLSISLRNTYLWSLIGFRDPDSVYLKRVKLAEIICTRKNSKCFLGEMGGIIMLGILHVQM